MVVLDKIKKKIEYKGYEITVSNTNDSVEVELYTKDVFSAGENWFVYKPTPIERLFGITFEDKVKKRIKKAIKYVDDYIDVEKEILDFVKDLDLNVIFEEIKNGEE